VFFDKKIQEIKNYAVMNEMLVVFDGTRTRKIPLRDVDLAANMKLNDSGVSIFRYRTKACATPDGKSFHGSSSQ
jgi:hypothetical protein